MHPVTKWETIANIGIIVIMVAMVTTNIHCWNQPYNFCMYKYLTKLDWILLGFGIGLLGIGLSKISD